ncbi:MAG: PilZ domain-containing protein [Desulfocapsaceae bacterium]|nr:PilZ domain-containing protein [Desulfocapsaceae bacterium]
MKIQEQRLQPRFSLDLQVKISARTLNNREVFHEETIAANISAGGAFIITDRQVPLASTIEMEFFLALDDLKKLQFILSVESLRACKEKHVWVKATGVVIRAEKRGVAVIFDTDYTIWPMSPSDSRETGPFSPA